VVRVTASDDRGPRRFATDDRGQLVLAAAGVVAVAVLAMAVAYLQLGAHPDVAAEREVGPREATDRAVAVLERTVADARIEHTGTPWADRDRVVDDVRADLAPALESPGPPASRKERRTPSGTTGRRPASTLANGARTGTAASSATARQSTESSSRSERARRPSSRSRSR